MNLPVIISAADNRFGWRGLRGRLGRGFEAVGGFYRGCDRCPGAIFENAPRMRKHLDS